MVGEAGPLRWWCCGLPLVGERRLTEQEREGLERAVRANRRRAWRWGLAGPPVTVALLGLGWWLLSAHRIHAPYLGVLILVGAVLAGAPSIILTIRDCRLRASIIRADLADGRVQRYADEDERATRASLEVFVGSGRLWRSNGQRVTLWQMLEPVQVADRPASATVAEQWLTATALDTGQVVGTGRRVLSPAEDEELRRRLRHVLGLGAGPLVMAVGVAVRMAAINEPDLPGWMRIVIGGVSLVFVLAAAWELWRMWRDRRCGAVLLVRTPADAEQGTPDVVEETLLVSGTLWTRDGVPAAWRTRYG